MMCMQVCGSMIRRKASHTLPECPASRHVGSPSSEWMVYNKDAFLCTLCAHYVAVLNLLAC